MFYPAHNLAKNDILWTIHARAHLKPSLWFLWRALLKEHHHDHIWRQNCGVSRLMLYATSFTTHHRWHRWNLPISPVTELSPVNLTVQTLLESLHLFMYPTYMPFQGTTVTCCILTFFTLKYSFRFIFLYHSACFRLPHCSNNTKIVTDRVNCLYLKCSWPDWPILFGNLDITGAGMVHPREAAAVQAGGVAELI